MTIGAPVPGRTLSPLTLRPSRERVSARSGFDRSRKGGGREGGLAFVPPTQPGAGALPRLGEQIAQRAPAKGVHPAPAPVFGRVMDHVAPLAERSEVARPVVARIVVEVRAGEHHARDEQLRRGLEPGEHELLALDRVGMPERAHATTVPVPPDPAIIVPPHAVAQVTDAPPVRTPAAFAPALGASEPDEARQLAPVDRVKPAMFGSDRHEGDSDSSTRGTEGEKAGSSRIMNGSTQRANACSTNIRFGDAHLVRLRFGEAARSAAPPNPRGRTSGPARRVAQP